MDRVFPDIPKNGDQARDIQIIFFAGAYVGLITSTPDESKPDEQAGKQFSDSIDLIKKRLDEYKK